MDDTTTIGATIRRYRAKRKLTLWEFGQLVGATASTVWTWERDLRIPSIARLPRLADTLGLSVKALIDRVPARDVVTVGESQGARCASRTRKPVGGAA